MNSFGRHPLHPTFQIVFQSAKQEIMWLLDDADLGHTWAQHRIGALYLASAESVDDLLQAYRWLFTCVALGDKRAQRELLQVMERLDEHEVNDAHRLVEEWFDEKLDVTEDSEEELYAPELRKWRSDLEMRH